MTARKQLYRQLVDIYGVRQKIRNMVAFAVLNPISKQYKISSKPYDIDARLVSRAPWIRSRAAYSSRTQTLVAKQYRATLTNFHGLVVISIWDFTDKIKTKSIFKQGYTMAMETRKGLIIANCRL